MTITVETGGPIDSIPEVIGPAASTFSDLILQIADEIDDTTGEYAGQIQSACYAAIRYCERDVYYFNETRDVTFTTVNGQEWYGAADNSNIRRLSASSRPTASALMASAPECVASRRKRSN